MESGFLGLHGAEGEKVRVKISDRARRGSALLIVLGFLSFMMVSAVAFAIYMRLERQGSSNYRHATTARHMLNTALARAVNEIDIELQQSPYRKFPETNGSDLDWNWEGRVRLSEVPVDGDDMGSARVLSLEALRYLPAIFINDIRYYSLAHGGAKWRQISMPTIDIGDRAWNTKAADGKAVVGRYAYTCVNLSDMLDVNKCPADMRDALTNRVAIAHLFDTEAERSDFDNDKLNEFKYFETLQDYYACMFSSSDDAMAGRRIDSAPALIYLKDGNDSVLSEPKKHLIVTDTFIQPQPTRNDLCNIYDSAHAPFKNLNGSWETLTYQQPFRDALTSTLGLGQAWWNTENEKKVFASMLADYLDTDNVPKALNRPVVERVPMVYGFKFLAADRFNPRIISETEGAGDDEITVYYLELCQDNPRIEVKTIYPFKYNSDRSSDTYRIEVIAYYRVGTDYTPDRTNRSFLEPLSPNGIPRHIQFTGGATITGIPQGVVQNPDNCCQHTGPFELSPADRNAIRIKLGDSTGTFEPGFGEGSNIDVSLMLFFRVKQGGVTVHSAPQLTEAVVSETEIERREFIAVPKLYMQCEPLPVPLSAEMSVPGNGMPFSWQWEALEVADPRFAWLADNWVQTPGGQPMAAELNQSTRNLLGQDGRDGDIYMASSNAGQMLSPYELGFLLRPFDYDVVGGGGVNYGNTDNTKAGVEGSAYNARDMFRTIRVYDHGSERADPIHRYFTARNTDADGTALGQLVNPLSDQSLVLRAALEFAPLDYGYAMPDTTASAAPIIKNTFNEYLGYTDSNPEASGWRALRDGWLNGLTNTVIRSDINRNLDKSLADYYSREDYFKWYSGSGGATELQRIFEHDLGKDLHEIDRKMLYGFTLDSFSERQQLFLYFLRAEVTVPSFGSSRSHSTRSLAGGRAVALVARDPYPVDYALDNNGKVGFHKHRILFFKQLDN